MLVRQKITSEREKNGLTTRELALRLNINRGTVSRWENGYIKTIPLDMLQKIAEIFNIKSKFALRW
jgi:transcriptional regulator with XRE-family HTH domain